MYNTTQIMGLTLEGLLHPPVQELAGLLVVELGDHLVEEVYEVGAGPGANKEFGQDG